jgi:hypothetical protein
MFTSIRSLIELAYCFLLACPIAQPSPAILRVTQRSIDLNFYVIFTRSTQIELRMGGHVFSSSCFISETGHRKFGNLEITQEIYVLITSLNESTIKRHRVY